MTLDIVLIFSSALLSIGIFGLLTRKNIVITLMSLELIFNSVVLAVIAFTRYSIHEDFILNSLTNENIFHVLSGNILGIFIISVAAGATALALNKVLALGKFDSTVDEWIYRR
jgi:NADH:ubiquinone oxidoreductase subunit 11 or 4L (chain K)